MLGRVGTFNIHHGRGRDGVVDLGRTARAITDAAVDLVALQELDRGRARSGGVDQPARLADLIGMPVHFFPTIEGDDGDYGIALAARDPIVPTFVALPHVGGDEPRGMIVTAWRGVSVVATHLSRDARVRRRQTELLARAATAQQPPVLVMGDLNQSGRRLAPLARAGFGVVRPLLATVGPPWWPRRVDHVLPGPGLRVRRAWTGGRGASDHRALFAELERTDRP